jgi:hypothetical protein
MMERGLGLDSEVATIALYKNYSEYRKTMRAARRLLFLEAEHPETFLINLKDKVHYRSLTFSILANHLSNAKENKE